MVRTPRLVVPGYPHHVTQRGNRRQRIFSSSDDCNSYLQLIAETTDMIPIEIWAYCLLPKHRHFVVVPTCENGLAAFFSHVQRFYTRRVNFRHGWRGQLWQERFHSVVMNERHLLGSVRYAELNPVRAGLCDAPEKWRWSSVQAHLKGSNDGITNVTPMAERVGDWGEYLTQSSDE